VLVGGAGARLHGATRPTGDVGADRQSAPVGTGTMTDVTTIYVGSWSELAKHTRPPTDDDVPVTRDGRRLDTPDKVRAFVEELKQQRPVDADA